MKLQLIIPALFLTFLSQAQQIPNGDFEDWQDSICFDYPSGPNMCNNIGLSPSNGWVFSYNTIGGATAYNYALARIKQSEISHSGKFALQLGNEASTHYNLGLTATNEFEFNVDLNNPPSFLELYSRISTDTNIIMSYNLALRSNSYYSVTNQVSNVYQKFLIPLDTLHLHEGINGITVSLSMVTAFYVEGNLYTVNLPADILFDSFKIVYDKPLSVDDSELSNAKTSICPNPFTNEILLKNYKGSISISDINGKNYYSNVSFSNEKINTESWPSGIYMLKTETKVQKIIKQ